MSAPLSKLTEFASNLSRAKSIAVLALCVIAVGLAAWIMRGDGQDAEDGLVEDDLFPELKLNGAMGVSDAGSSFKSDPGAPLLLPNTADGVSDTRMLEEDDSEEPLFPGKQTLGTATQQTAPKIETAAFIQAPASNAKPIAPNGTRVTSNQPVWLTGTIELETSGRPQRQPQ